VRILTMFYLLAGVSGVSLAHELGAAHSEAQQLAHQWFSLHHLPGIVLIAAVAVWLVRIARRARKSRGEIINP